MLVLKILTSLTLRKTRIHSIIHFLGNVKLHTGACVIHVQNDSPALLSELMPLHCLAATQQH